MEVMEGGEGEDEDDDEQEEDSDDDEGEEDEDSDDEDYETQGFDGSSFIGSKIKAMLAGKSVYEYVCMYIYVCL